MARVFDEAPPSMERPPEIVTKKSYEIRIVTPMFGGGVKAGENDMNMLVRPSSIRGQLRFWWRTVRGAYFQDGTAMRDAENAVWGSTRLPSAVNIRVTEQPRSNKQRGPEDNFRFDRFGPEAYALFAAKSNGNRLLQEGGTFDLEISYPKNWNEEKIRQNVEARSGPGSTSAASALEQDAAAEHWPVNNGLPPMPLP